MTAFREYLTSRIVQLEGEGSARSASVDLLVGATDLDAAAVEDFFAGDLEIDDLEVCRKMGAALGLDEIEALEVAADGQLVEGYAELEGGAFEGLGRKQSRADAVLGVNEFVYATGKPARDHDVIDIATYRLGQFSRNPVVLFNHDPNRLIGRSYKHRRDVENDRIVGEVRWDMNPDNPDANRVARQVHEDVLSSMSVRWITGKFVRFDELPDTDPRFRSKPIKIHTRWGTFDHMGGVHFDGVQLEVSAVTIPSDTGAKKLRGLGATAGRMLRQLDQRDPAAAVDVRGGLRELLADPETWSDEVFVRHLSGTLAHLIRTDRELRGLLRAVNLTGPTPRRSSDPDSTDAAALLAHAAKSLGG